MDEADLEYLRPEFEPQSVTVPRLRNILVAENVPYPSSAKKADLIELFNLHIKPKAKKLLAARERTKRSTRGIKDVPSSQEGSVANDDLSDPDTTISAPVVSTTKRGGRKSTRAATEEVSVPTPRPAPAEKAPSKRASGKHARQSDAEADSRPARRTHLSAEPAAPVAKEEDDSEPEAWHRHDAESPFTADNPFQSGSSPVMDARPVKKENRRKTLGPVERRSKVSVDAHRRRTDFPIVEQLESDIIPPTSHTFEIPISQITKSKKAAAKKEARVAEAGEEFTPEEQLELEEEQQKTGQLDVLPPRRSQVARRAAGPVKSIGWATVFSLLIAFAAMWRQEKLAVGYCGIGQPSQQIAGVEVPEWAEVLRPQCELCPPHAFCHENLQTNCEEDFILRPHPLSLGGLVPLPPSCEPDSEKARKVKQVADRIVEELRERNAKFECGELVDEEGHHLDNAAMAEEELKETVASKRRKGMSNDEFEDLWRGAIGDVVTREEIVTTVQPNPSTSRSLLSTSLARVSLQCAIRRSIRLALARHLGKLVIFFLVISGAGYTRYSIQSTKATEAKAKELASYALDRLATQAALHAYDANSYPEEYISMVHLRDDVLRDEFSATRRQKLWEQVQKKVEGNSNVRPMMREGRRGDVSRVWEWVGAVRAIDDGGNRRESSRYSLGPAISSSPPRGMTPVKDENGGSRPQMAETRNWEEGRPIY